MRSHCTEKDATADSSVGRRGCSQRPPQGFGTDSAVITELATRLEHGARFTADPRAVLEKSADRGFTQIAA